MAIAALGPISAVLWLSCFATTLLAYLYRDVQASDRHVAAVRTEQRPYSRSDLAR